LRGEDSYYTQVATLARDPEEDVYVRLEAASFLASVCGRAARELFAPYYDNTDQQIQLEAVIALGEANTTDAISLLSAILDDPQRPYFLRSASAWSLSRVNKPEALSRLIRAFADVDHNIREEALEGVASVGGPSVPLLIAGLRGSVPEIAAGCAESLRQQQVLPDDVVAAILEDLRSQKATIWTTWLIGHLPRERVATAIADLQRSAPHLHYAVSVLWSFVESWIARRWELSPLPNPETVNRVSDSEKS
jgi:HEAT repeat protein